MPTDAQPSQTERQKHWFCEACGTFDGPRSAAFCDVCSDGAKVQGLVLADDALAAVFDALSIMQPETAAKWRSENSYKRLAEALRR